MVSAYAPQVAARWPAAREVVPAPGADHLLPLRVPDLIAQLAAGLAAPVAG